MYKSLNNKIYKKIILSDFQWLVNEKALKSNMSEKHPYEDYEKFSVSKRSPGYFHELVRIFEYSKISINPIHQTEWPVK